MSATVEWFGTTTYRLKANGLTIFLDTWLERPSVLPKYLDVDDVDEADYILISHAHFDHLPGADRIAKRTGAVIIANGEAINLLRGAGVPDEQLLAVAGGERIPLFTRSDRQAAAVGTVGTAPAPPGAPCRPEDSLAVMSVDVWPSLHCFMPAGPGGQHPDTIDTATVYTGEASPYTCTLDITRGMKHGLLRLGQLMPPEAMDEGTRSFVAYVEDRERHLFSHYDGGQLAFNLRIGLGRTVFWSAHMGAYDGVLRAMEPKPDVAILALAGRANLNGRPYDGSAADFVVEKIKWLGEPATVIWCLHDESLIKPYRVDTVAADSKVHRETSSRVLTLEKTVPTPLFP
ncbi:beta-lactamase domain protein [Colletotrichum musicola]|uniref:Beta-lactamase domain protein n=1 Tax=Colletotrichum musicola TaxID=2175873 RepID=A0A8H6JNX9_9PEZI|nr:beta-lactamase domain protein [Colletotrichum musicola]